MKKRTEWFRVIIFILSMLIITGVVFSHGSISVKRVVVAVLAMGIGTVLLLLLDRCVDKGFKVDEVLQIKIKTVGLLELLAFLIVTVGALFVRYRFLYFESVDGIAFFAPWIEQFRALGIKTSLGCNITDYSCMRTTIDIFMSLLPFKALTVAKIVPIICDFVNAVLALVIFNEITKESVWSVKGVLLYACMLLNPITVLNGAAWAQSDSFYTVFVLAAVFFLLKLSEGDERKSDLAVIMFALAFACKLQAIFTIPVLFFFWVMQKRTESFKGIRISQLIWFPIVYFLTGLPMFLCGRTLGAIFGVYFEETGKYLSQLTLRYYNVYCLIGEKAAGNEVNGYVTYGIILALGALLCFYYCAFKRGIELKGENLLKLTSVTVLLLLFLLPCMHERYAFVGEMVVIILAVLNRKYIAMAIATVLATSVTYADYLMGAECFTNAVPAWLVACVRLIVLVFMIKDFFNVKETV